MLFRSRHTIVRVFWAEDAVTDTPLGGWVEQQSIYVIITKLITVDGGNKTSPG